MYVSFSSRYVKCGCLLPTYYTISKIVLLYVIPQRVLLLWELQTTRTSKILVHANVIYSVEEENSKGFGLPYYRWFFSKITVIPSWNNCINIVTVVFSIRNSIFPSPLVIWNTEYRPFSIQITEIPSRRLANIEYRHIVRPPYSDYYV